MKEKEQLAFKSQVNAGKKHNKWKSFDLPQSLLSCVVYQSIGVERKRILNV